jgi:hypothetical protein
VIRVYDNAGKVFETHEHAGDFKEWRNAELATVQTLNDRRSHLPGYAAWEIHPVMRLQLVGDRAAVADDD